jgi:hypothetical protein
MGGIDWIDLAQDRNRWRAFVNAVMYLWLPYNAENFLSSLGHISFSGRTLLVDLVKLVKSFSDARKET